MKTKIFLMILWVVFSIATYASASEGLGHHEHIEGVLEDSKDSMMEHGEAGAMKEPMKEEESSSVEVGNKICPVSGEKVGMMGPAVQYEYEGKIYNFCCAGCVETFKKDPERYVKIVEEQIGRRKKMGSEHGHEGQHHVMGEKDENMMAETVDEKSAQAKEEVAPTAQVEEFDLEAYQHGYSPERIVVKKGSIVKLHATSRDVPHGIFIKEYGINEKVEKGKVKDIEFIADKAGEFDILCSVYCGRGHHSMKAKLVVKE